MNYIRLADVSRDFIYNRHTSALICYVPGSRPVLEKIARKICARARSPLHRVTLLAQFVAEEVRWAGFYERETGRRLPDDRNLTEEQILQSGFGWCNEQARLLCTLAQISEIPARLVFGSNRPGTYGHVVTEVLTHKGWMLIDQSLGYCFRRAGRPVNAWEVWHVPALAKHFGPIYRSLCGQLAATLGRDILARSFGMALVENPLCGFAALGYCNHFV
jgi:transglutaminase-like putative cysteine protease